MDVMHGYVLGPTCRPIDTPGTVVSCDAGTVNTVHVEGTICNVTCQSGFVMTSDADVTGEHRVECVEADGGTVRWDVAIPTCESKNNIAPL